MLSTTIPPLTDKLTDFQDLDVALSKFEIKDLSSLGLPESPAEYDIFLTRLHHLSSCLASHRNTFIPINRLPVNILAQIFEMVQAQYWGCDEDGVIFWGLRYSNDPSFCSWLKPFTEVCHYWRQITTSTKHFWQTIWLSHRYKGAVDLMKLFLARSSPLPFRLKWFHSVDHYLRHERDTALSIVREEAHRLELLQVLGPLTQYPEFTKSVLDIPVPNLHYLSLSAYQYTGQIVDSTLAPNLHRFSFQGAASLPGVLCSNITHLYMSGLNDVPQMWQFFQLLRTLPLLKQFEWHQCWPLTPSSAASYHELRPVALPHLQQIILFDRSHNFWEIPLLLFHKLELPDSVERSWGSASYNSKTPPLSATLSVEPMFSSAEFLLCREGLMCSFNNGVLAIPNIELLGVYGPHLHSIRAFASSEVLPENMTEIYPQISASPVENFHIFADTANLHLFSNLETSNPCLFPKLRVFTLWTQSWGSSKLPSIFQKNGQLADLWECLLKTGQATRTRVDGSIYVVKLRNEGRIWSSRAFHLDWIVDQWRALKVDGSMEATRQDS